MEWILASIASRRAFGCSCREFIGRRWPSKPDKLFLGVFCGTIFPARTSRFQLAPRKKNVEEKHPRRHKRIFEQKKLIYVPQVKLTLSGASFAKRGKYPARSCHQVRFVKTRTNRRNNLIRSDKAILSPFATPRLLHETRKKISYVRKATKE